MLHRLAGIRLILFFNFGIDLVICHLKDLGEVTLNFTALDTEIENRIAGGEPVNLEKFPFHAQFFNGGGLCAAIIVTSKIVLTAAHCFESNKNMADMRIFAASRYLFDHYAQKHDVWDYVIHQHYNEAVMFSNDIAAIMIQETFVFGPLVKAAVLSNGQSWMKENNQYMFIASGWGETAYGHELSQRGLLKANLRYISVETCKELNKGVEFSPEMFCLYGDGKRDTCRGDSGGGIVWKNVVVGIVSHGSGCAEAPGMYVNVYYYKGWIQDTAAELSRRYNAFHDAVGTVNSATQYNKESVMFRLNQTIN